MNIRNQTSFERASTARPVIQLLSRWLTDWLPALPLLIITFCLLIAPVGAMIFRSFYDDSSAFTLVNWIKTLSSHANQDAIVSSVKLAAVCATISLLVGGPLSWMISHMAPARRSSWLALFNVVTNFSGIGLAFGYIATLGTLGMVTLALLELNSPFAPPSPASFWGLVIAYEYTNIPLFVLLTLPAMGIIRQEWWEAAQTSAATSWQFWRAVGLPILTPFLAAGWLLIFTWALGMYALPFALTGAGFGSAGSIRLITLQMGLALQASFTGPGEVAVLAVVLLMIATISLFTYRFLLHKAARWVI